jgi:hypothetical protein
LSANDRQPGGGHYKGREYQHWDWVTDIRLHYLPANASKYVTRWRDKGGLLDLEKAIHYLDKAVERGVGFSATAEIIEATERFTAQLPVREAYAIFDMVHGRFYRAKDHIKILINAEELNS